MDLSYQEDARRCQAAGVLSVEYVQQQITNSHARIIQNHGEEQNPHKIGDIKAIQSI